MHQKSSEKLPSFFKGIEADGNCLYRSLAEAIYGGEELHAQVRKEMMEFLLGNRGNPYSRFFTAIGDKSATVEEYAAHYTQPSSEPDRWRTSQQLLLAAKLYDKNIILFQPKELTQFVNYSVVSIELMNLNLLAQSAAGGAQPASSASGGTQPASSAAGGGQPTSSASGGAQPSSSAASTLAPIGGAPQATTTPVTSVFGESKDIVKMSYKDLEQTLKVLRMDFESQQKQFLDEVDDLNTYDNILRRAQDKISGLAVDVDQLEREKDRFKYELQVVEQQQTELDNLVTEMEKVLGLPDYTQGTPIGLREPATTADIQRQNILQLQVTVDAQLKQIDDDVTDICEQLLDLQKIGGVNGFESGDVDPEKEEQASIMDQIRQILRKQIDTLGWVDKQSDMLAKKVKKTAAEILTLQK